MVKFVQKKKSRKNVDCELKVNKTCLVIDNSYGFGKRVMIYDTSKIAGSL